MSFVTNISGAARPNFLESEVGLVLKTHEIPATLGVQDGIYKTVAPGTVFRPMTVRQRASFLKRST